MKPRTMKYFFKEALKSMKRNGLMTLASISTVALSLFMLGVFLCGVINLNNMASSLENQVQLSVYLKDGLTTEQIMAVGKQVKAIPNLKHLEFVNKENTFVCGDDGYLAKLDVNRIGFNDNNTHKIESYEFSDKGSKFVLDGKEYEMSLLGKHNISNTAIAIELAKKIGLTDEEIQSGLKEIKISNMRFQEIKIGEDIYINDAYNASPTSMKAAIDTLNEIYNDKYKIAILGDMLELGENEVDYHIDVLNYLLDKKIKLIYLYGERMKKAYDIFMKSKSEEYRFWYYPTKEGIVESLKNIRMEKVILLKASRGTALEDIIKQ